MTVELWDPSSEGPWIAGQLRQAGFSVRSVEAADVPLTRGALLVMAGDADGALALLKLLRDEGENGDVPVILLGTPPGTEHRGEGPGFGADAVFTRPVSFEALLDCARRLLDAADGAAEVSGVSGPPVERTMQLSNDDPDSSQVVIRTPAPYVEGDPPAPPWRPREPTLQLDDDGSSPGDEISMVTRGRARRSSAPPPSSVTGRRRTPTSGPELIGSRPEGTGSQRTGSQGTGSQGTGSQGTPSQGTPGPGTPGRGTPMHGRDAPQPVIPPDRRAKLSPWLVELLAAADRRVFPDRPPLAIHLPAADEPPESLVPPELFDAASMRLDEPFVEDPIDAFTFVGGPAVPPPVHGVGTGDGSGESEAAPPSSRAPSSRAPSSRAPSSSAPSSSAPPSPVSSSPVSSSPVSSSPAPTEVPRTRGSMPTDHTTATELPDELTPGSGVHRASAFPMPAPRGGDWPEDDTVLGRVTPEGVRRGTLGPGGALRLLWRLASLGLDAICELVTDGGTTRMTFLSGELRALEGKVASAALESLRCRGRATEHPQDEAGAEAILQRRVDAGELARFERDRLLREAREQLLTELVAADRAEFVLHRLEDTQPGRVLSRSRVLSRPLRAALVEAARHALSAERVRELLGEPVALALGPRREAALSPAELPSELVELVCRMDGRTLNEILGAAPTEPGLAGVLYALVASDALVLAEPPADAEPALAARGPVLSLLDAAAALALDADYFTVLGLGRNASGAEVERAYRSRRDELSALPLGVLGLHALEPRRAEALDAVEEARRILGDPRLRRLYAAAL